MPTSTARQPIRSLLLAGLFSYLVILPRVSELGAQGPSRVDVAFASAGITLAGTLHQPSGPGPYPAVALIHGSGRTYREDLAYFTALFVRSGVAALVWDKRGVGGSGGAQDAWRRFSLEDLAGDAEAAAQFLQHRSGIDRERVGIFGVSQGGWIAPLAASKLPGLRFLVVVSASLTTIAEDNVFERAARLRREGFSAADVEIARHMHEVDNDVSRGRPVYDEFVTLWEKYNGAPWFRRVYADPAPAPPGNAYRTWYRTVMDVDPMPAWQALSVPILFVTGDSALDPLSPVARNVTLVDSLKRQGKSVDLITFDGADHNLKRGGHDADLFTPLAAWLRRVLQ